MPLGLRDIARQDRGGCLRHRDDRATRLREFVSRCVHLAEVGIAGDSGQVAQEDKEQEVTIDKLRQPDGGFVRTQKGELGSNIAGGHFLSFSRRKVIGTRPRGVVA